MSFTPNSYRSGEEGKGPRRGLGVGGGECTFEGEDRRVIST